MSFRDEQLLLLRNANSAFAWSSGPNGHGPLEYAACTGEWLSSTVRMALLYIESVSGHRLAIGPVRYTVLLLGAIRDVRIILPTS